LLGVETLAAPGYLIEVDAIAVVDQVFRRGVSSVAVIIAMASWSGSRPAVISSAALCSML
jgi:hypothetical protein